MGDRRWKREERAVAQAVGGERVGPTGRNTADVISPVYGVEVKSRKELPAWLTGALNQARCNCPPGKTPLLVICHCPGQGRKVRRYAVLDLDHYKELAPAAYIPCARTARPGGVRVVLLVRSRACHPWTLMPPLPLWPRTRTQRNHRGYAA